MVESSRICVKNIGKATKETELRNLFGKCGEVTDLKILRRPDGSSRNFAFIGYRSADQAQNAVKYFNNTFIGLSKLSVSIALRLGEVDEKTKLRKDKKSSSIEAPSSGAPAGAPQKQLPNADAASTVLFKDDKPIGKKKEKFLEFALGKGKELVATASGASGPSHSEATLEPSMDDGDDDVSHMSVDNDKDRKKNAGNNSDSDSDYNNSDEEDNDGFAELSDLKPLSDLDYLRSKIVRKDGQEIEKIVMSSSGSRPAVTNESDNSDSHSDDGKQEQDYYSDDDSAMDLDDLVKNPTQKKVRKTSQSQKEKSLADSSQSVRSNHDEEKDDEAVVPPSSEGEGQDVVHSAPPHQSNRLYVTNLPYNTTEEEVRAHFVQALGNDESSVLEVHLPLGREDKRGRGFGFVRLASLVAAEAAINALHGSAFQGRVLHIAFASEQQQSKQSLVFGGGGDEGLGWSAFQKKKEEERRKLLAVASNSEKSAWNASYVKSDAVLDTMAERYRSSAGDLLDVLGQQGGDVAVRMALAETQVVMDNATFLATHNVSLDNTANDASKSTSKRSDHILLVKNLPVDTLGEELEAMFARYGALSSFTLAPNRTLALAEFLEPSEARAAYKGLAYRRYRTVPLYLEWAPMSTTTNSNRSSSNANAAAASIAVATASSSPSKVSQNTASQNHAPEADGDIVATCSVFIKNLNFTTDETALRNHILRVLPVSLTSSLRSVVVQKKQKRVDGPLLSLGYGFAEFLNRPAAMTALGRIQGSVLDDHALEAQLSAKRLTETNNASNVTSSSSRKPKTKLLVKNVAFQATKKEIRDLFAAHGLVTSVRLPKTMAAAGSSGSLRHRGFAFVDFATAQEAQNAKAALSHAHLYGRHLVIDFEEDQPQMQEDGGDGADAADGAMMDTLSKGRKRALRDAELLESAAKTNSKKRKNNANSGGDAMAVDAAENKQMRSLL
jgi:multiple RNA-binding domain-containing protein 1